MRGSEKSLATEIRSWYRPTQQLHRSVNITAKYLLFWSSTVRRATATEVQTGRASLRATLVWLVDLSCYPALLVASDFRRFSQLQRIFSSYLRFLLLYNEHPAGNDPCDYPRRTLYHVIRSSYLCYPVICGGLKIEHGPRHGCCFPQCLVHLLGFYIFRLRKER